MLAGRQVVQGALFYEFSLESHVPAGHMRRSIDRFVDLCDLRAHLAPFYSPTGRPSVDPELLIRMLIVGYCFGIRSERRLCEDVHLNLAYRWFCRLGLEGEVPEQVIQDRCVNLPCRIGGETNAVVRIKSFHRLHQAYVPFADQL